MVSSVCWLLLHPLVPRHPCPTAGGSSATRIPCTDCSLSLQRMTAKGEGLWGTKRIPVLLLAPEKAGITV